MREDDSPSSTSILLGRPFLKMARTKIDVHSGTLSMEFDGEIIKSNIYDSMRYPFDIPTALLVDVVDPLVQALSSTNSEDHVKFVLEESLTPVLVQILEEDITAPALELKELSKHLKYAYLGENNTLPVIISSKLNTLEEEKLIRVLREFKEAIRWTIADIKGLSPSTCMHRILLEEGTKPSREAQRRLNPPMMEVVKKEILKLLDAGFHQIPVPPQIKTRRRSHVLLELLLIEGCRLDYAMRRQPSKDVWSVFSDFVEQFIEVFMDDFTVYGDSFDDCLEN
ncbi:UNVERIFIED_CONTAM: hypothetical protein Sangu_2424400 [Sesamum angustifolium]|uniref:Uncharacterized protein n=1 Tax=Sesamum angustifolium TaxID=2727405 RepID=A0AAW2KWE4_9LAMI